MVDKKAIVPGVYGHSKCSAGQSIYVTTYQRPVTEKQDLQESKKRSFVNRLNSHETHFRTKDSDLYLKNMTTTSDVVYNIRPAKVRAEAEGGGKLIEKTEDLLGPHYDATETGLIRSLHCERMREEALRNRTTYNSDFPERRMRPREKTLLELRRKCKQSPPFSTDE
ncbi:uncharacterized protein LOC128867915 [Anastrepha ludens]|uniref:uncharacterized protein LOC128867915 n=1 Tax=Anastrepha ludens TaxID=28586 RepID=UPI0023AF5717|nr:uncharacterized protein LOC128867915 [Anastrepha ludens]